MSKSPFAKYARARSERLIGDGRCRKCGAPAKVAANGRRLKHCAACIAREAGRVIAKRAIAAQQEGPG